MKRKITVETDVGKVVEVKTVWAEEEANQLLASGKWTLLHGGLAHKDNIGYQAKSCFILGRLE